MSQLAERGEKWAKRNGRSPYNVMDQSDICGLPVGELAARDSILFMWATYPKLWEAFEVIAAWGFEYKTVGFTWVKTNPKGLKVRFGALVNLLCPLLGKAKFERWVRLDPAIVAGWHFGLGYHTRGNPEICLLASRGRGLRRVDNSVPNLLVAPVGEHSQKPAETRCRIERLYGDLPRLELFARQRAEGWAIWGNEAPGGSDVDLAPQRYKNGHVDSMR